jgi:hypothetical protein
MPYTKKIICLANSRKPPSGRCIAGREISQGVIGDWIRPVSARPTREISEEERRFENGQQTAVLDVVSIQMTAPAPDRHQQENHQIDGDYYWFKGRRASWDELLGAIEVVNGPLWSNHSSSYYGTNDRVADAELGGLPRSLYLIRPEALRVVVVTEGTQFNNPRRRVRARFLLSGNEYYLFVTDPIVETEYLAQADGQYPVADAVVCVSLGEVHTDGFAYKLAASIITPQRAGE